MHACATLPATCLCHTWIGFRWEWMVVSVCVLCVCVCQCAIIWVSTHTQNRLKLHVCLWFGTIHPPSLSPSPLLWAWCDLVCVCAVCTALHAQTSFFGGKTCQTSLSCFLYHTHTHTHFRTCVSDCSSSFCLLFIKIDFHLCVSFFFFSSVCVSINNLVLSDLTQVPEDFALLRGRGSPHLPICANFLCGNDGLLSCATPAERMDDGLQIQTGVQLIGGGVASS